jgi:hypothetical protein
LDARSGRVNAMNRGPGTISVNDPDTDAIIDTLKADRGILTALNPVTNKLHVSASTGTDPSVIDLATKSSMAIHAGTEGKFSLRTAVARLSHPIGRTAAVHFA